MVSIRVDLLVGWLIPSNHCKKSQRWAEYLLPFQILVLNLKTTPNPCLKLQSSAVFLWLLSCNPIHSTNYYRFNRKSIYKLHDSLYAYTVCQSFTYLKNCSSDQRFSSGSAVSSVKSIWSGVLRIRFLGTGMHAYAVNLSSDHTLPQKALH